MPLNYLSNENDSVMCECSVCKQVLIIEKEKLTFITRGYYVVKKDGIQCSSCDSYYNYIGDQIERKPNKTATVKEVQELKCPVCKSTNLTANNKGFGLGKAVVGGLLIGPVGLLGGLVGSKKPVFICLKCGNQFEAGS